MMNFETKTTLAKAIEARYWEPRPDRAVVCTLCPHRCHVGEGLYGVCGVRRNDGGRLETLVYGLTAAVNVDPIEKKPLFHFLPGSRSLSVATVGCSFKCAFCQNHDISQASKGKKRELFGRYVSPGEVVALAKSTGAERIEKMLVAKRLLPSFARGAKFITMFLEEAKIVRFLRDANRTP